MNWAQEISATLHTVIDQIKLKHKLNRVSILDIPCGDMAWMQRFLLTRDDVEYTGADIVSELINSHKTVYKNWQFIELDIVNDTMPGAYDLILNRMMLQHLFYKDIVRVLMKFSASKSRYLLSTTFSKTSLNKELALGTDNPGRFRYLNLQLRPIALTAPLCLQRDGPPNVFEGWEHFIGLWKLPLTQVEACKDVYRYSTKDQVTLCSCSLIQ